MKEFAVDIRSQRIGALILILITSLFFKSSFDIPLRAKSNRRHISHGQVVA